MVRDGIYYALGMAAAALAAWHLLGPAWALPALLLGAFCLWFFRDPERAIPGEPGLVVSPADGKVTDVSAVPTPRGERTRISIFLSVFDVHVNRAPVGGVIRAAEYRKGRFRNAMGAASSEENEQNVVTVESEGQDFVFKQIAGLIARRIVFTKRIGDTVARGERVGLIKFGSRVDLLLPPGHQVRVKVGDRVRGGASVLAAMQRSAAPMQYTRPADAPSAAPGGRS
jgi:phosphatidylserine decarboxylase